MLRSILVPLDGSTFGEHALPMAATLARRADATLHLDHVHQMIPPATVAGVAIMDSFDLHLQQDELAYLSDVTRRVREKGPINVQSALLEGEVVKALQAQAARVAADFVVMCTHGRGAMGRFWLGSIADELLNTLPLPVLLVRPGEGRTELKREANLRSILLPLDGEPHAERILEFATELGKLFESTLTLMRVVRPVIRESYLPEGGTIQGLEHTAVDTIQKTQLHLQDEAHRYLDEVAARLRQQQPIRVNTQVVIAEEPATAILREAGLRNAGLIALETHGRKGLSRLVRGSVAYKIVRGGEVPVLLHRGA